MKHPPRHSQSSRLGQLASLVLGGLCALATPVQAQVAGSIDIWPANSTVELGGTKQYGAYVPINPNTVNWSVNGVVGGDSTVGTISAAGLYTPPSAAPANNVVAIRATSTAYPSSYAQTSLTITRKYPWLWSLYPSSIQVGGYSVSLNGANFAPDSKVLVNGVAVPTTYFSSTKLVATGVASQVGTLNVAVQQPGPGSVTGNSVSLSVKAATVTLAVSPVSASVPLAGAQTFAASVSGSSNTGVTWSVNGLAGGAATIGTISSSGVYTAPATMPASSTVTITAASMASPSTTASATVTLTVPPPPVIVSVSPTSASLQVGTSQAFAASVSGSANTSVTWSVNGVTGGSALTGFISPAGVYTAPAAMPASPTVAIKALAAANGTSFGTATVTLTMPPPPTVWMPGARFLEQTSFGPTPATLAKVQQMGFQAYLDEQFNLPATQIPTFSDNNMGSLKQWALYNYTVAPDQLRQRVVFALGQIIVTSGAKLIYADEMIPWLSLLNQHAFGNYRDLLKDISLSPSMGKYLDLANSVKPGVAGGANENYAREIMQLFTIGLWQLNQDGSLVLDGNGNPVPTYNQATIKQVALALTGWTYPTAAGVTPNLNTLNWENFSGPMEARPKYHDTSSKSVLGVTIPAGQTVQQDLDSVIDILMNHPNTAPFIATRLIRLLVMSNPSPAYIQRVADVFVNNGAGVRGDLKAVVTAIIMDPDARQDVPTVNSGRLKDHILQVTGFLRSLNGQFTSGQQLTYIFDYLAQSILAPPSVFNWYSPLYHVPKSPLFGPEFQIYTPSEATSRGNLIFYFINQSAGDTIIDLTPFQPYGNDMTGLVEVANQILLYGRMPAEVKQAIITAAAPGYDAKTRIETVLYLTALTGQYAVQH